MLRIGIQNSIDEPLSFPALIGCPTGRLLVLVSLPSVVAAARHFKEPALLADCEANAASEGDIGTLLIYKFVKASSVRLTFFLEASPDEAPSTIARTLKSISAVHIFTAFPKLKERKF